jgi:Tol biopolymer transport system component
MPVEAGYVPHLIDGPGEVSEDLPPEDFVSYVVSEDTHRIIYLKVDSDSETRRTASAIYSVRTDGTQRMRLADCPADEYLLCFLWYEVSPDGSYVAYWRSVVDQEGEFQSTDLFLVSVSGGQATTVASGVIGMFFSPDSAKLAYVVPSPNSQPDDQRADLYIVDTLLEEPASAGPLLVAHDIPPGEIQFSADSQYAIYYGPGIELDSGAHFGGVYSVPVTGGDSVLLRCPDELPEPGQIFLRDGDSAIVVCRWNSFYEIYSFALADGARTLLSKQAELTIDGIQGPIVSGDRLNYVRWDDTGKHYQLVSVTLDGGSPVVLAKSESPLSRLDLKAVSQDGKLALFTRDEAEGRILYSTSTEKPSLQRLAVLASLTDWSVTLSPDGTRAAVARTSRYSLNDPPETPFLISVPTTGGEPVTLMDTVYGRDIVGQLLFSADGAWLLFAMGGSLYLADPGGSTVLPIGRNVSEFDFGGQDDIIVYSDRAGNLYTSAPGIDLYLPSLAHVRW